MYVVSILFLTLRFSYYLLADFIFLITLWLFIFILRLFLIWFFCFFLFVVSTHLCRQCMMAFQNNHFIFVWLCQLPVNVSECVEVISINFIYRIFNYKCVSWILRRKFNGFFMPFLWLISSHVLFKLENVFNVISANFNFAFMFVILCSAFFFFGLWIYNSTINLQK